MKKGEKNMPNIRYVCLSDMHLGSATSLLSNLKAASSELDFSTPSPVLKQLVECLKELIAQNVDKSKKPTLVLNGDTLELALAEYNEAAMVFESFINLIMPPGAELFDRIVYIPGNHDHHLWEMARETQYVDNYVSTIPWGTRLEAPWHVTNTFRIENVVKSYFLTQMIQRLPHLKDRFIEINYPNFGLLDKDVDATKCVVFSHGHFLESLYLLISILKNLLFPERTVPTDIWDLEAENFAWIDFFWSSLGRSSDAGKGVSCVYEKLRDKKQVKKLLSNLAEGLAKKYDLPGWGDKMEAGLLEWAFNLAVNGISGLERNQPDVPLSKDAASGLYTYLQGPLRRQIISECGGKVPDETTFIFGHTHKPFQAEWRFMGYSGWVNVYNSGGWVVDTVEPQPLHGGSVILVDEDLNAASLSMYKESSNIGDYQVCVQEALHPGDKPGDFFKYLEGLVAKTPELWTMFSDATARAVNVREQGLLARINSPGY
jgi:hypothetical protein